MYTVIGHPRSRVLRVIWALEEMGLPYDIDPVGPQSEGIRAHNPLGKIPALRDGDTVITDSVAILTYLADKHGKLTAPAGTLARARQDSMMQFAVAEIDAALWSMSKHRFVLPEKLRIAEMKDVAAKEYSRAMKQLGDLMGDAPFAAGDTFTVPDIVISHCAGWGLTSKLPLPEGKVGAYLKSLRARPAMRRTLDQVAKYS